jgi:hypothetical protein
MAETNTIQNRDDNMRKLGIREIQERLEVSPIITDPGTFGLNAEDPGGKNYNCNLVIQAPETWGI